MSPGADKDRGGAKMVTVEIDGRQHQVEAGRNMLDIALSLGYDLPFFCWHPVMGSIGACRQCAVKQYWIGRDGNERHEIVMACMTEAQEGTRIVIDDEEAIRFRAEMIELMMMSHPHDCPICDEGGECHLQDMTVMTGHSYRRYRGLKRTFEDRDLGPFVIQEFNRCITCYRCTRFYNDYAGGRDFGVFGLRNQIYFGPHHDTTLESEFSGNLVEVCPTGVFDDKTLARHYSRKWDLQTAPSVCPHCGLGCTTHPGERYGELRRVVSRYSREINKMFLCDRGRYGYEYVNAPQRIREPLVARPATPEAATEQAAVTDLDEAAALPGLEPPATRRQKSAAAGHALGLAAVWLRRGTVIGIGSPRASLEDNYALRTLVGAERFYLGMSDADADLVGEVLRIAADPELRLASLADVHAADAVFVLGEDVTNVAPMLDLTLRTWLRLRPTEDEVRVHITRWNDAAIGRFKRREPSVLWLATSHATKLDEVAREAWRATPDGISRLALALTHELDAAAPAVDDLDDDERAVVGRWAEALKASTRPLIVAGTSSGSMDLLRAAARLAQALPRGASDAGEDAGDDQTTEPAPEPARLLLTVPEANSVGLRMLGGGRLSAAFAEVARGAADTVVLLDNDLRRRAPSLMVDDFLTRRPRIVALASLESEATQHADLVLPASTPPESTGTCVNNEGRAQRFFRVFDDGLSREAWRWLRDLLEWLGRPEGRTWGGLDDLLAALEEELPRFRGVAAAAPAAGWRDAGAKVARQPARWSGRTAKDADATVFEPPLPPDPDSALAFSLEGVGPLDAPAALLPRTWSPRWNSASGLHKLQEEVNGPLRGGPVGARLLDGAAAAEAFATMPAAPLTAPGRRQRRPGEWLLVPLHHIFGSDDLSMYSPGVAERAPEPYIGLNDADARRLELEEGDWLLAWLPWLDVRVPWRRLPSLPDGVAGLPVGLPGMPFADLPYRTRLLRLERPPEEGWRWRSRRREVHGAAPAPDEAGA